MKPAAGEPILFSYLSIWSCFIFPEDSKDICKPTWSIAFNFSFAFKQIYALLNLNAKFLTLFVLPAPSRSSSSFSGSTKSTGTTLIPGEVVSCGV